MLHYMLAHMPAPPAAFMPSHSQLDIDNNPVEIAFIKQLLASKQLQSIVDELFWENHVRGPMQWLGWGNLASLEGDIVTSHDSYQTFLRLRKTGIRAHSWV